QSYQEDLSASPNQQQQLSVLQQQQQQQQQPAHQYQSQVEHHGQTPSSESIIDAAAAAAAAAVAAAHHGLEVLQAATTAPQQQQQQHEAPPQSSQYTPTPQTSQYTPAPQAPQYSPGSQSSPYPPLSSVGHGGQYQMASVAIPPSQPRHQDTTKATRLRRACDMCSARKVKCDEAGPPCKPCRDLNVECKFERAMKRRGPPNKHAEAVRNKRPRLEPSFAAPMQQNVQQLTQTTMSPNPHNAAEALVSIGAPRLIGAGGLDAEAIAPWPVLTLLVDDFFTYIHPLAPFPHEPTFKDQFQSRRDRTDPGFLALLSSMIGCLVASFPRTARLHLKSQQSSNLFPRAITMIERCRAVALEARGAQFMNKEEVTVYDAATSYFLGLAAGYTMQWKLCRRFMTETLSFVREMGYHKPRDLGSSMGITYRGPAFDHVQDQMGKRIFWVMFLGIRSMAQLGAPHSEIILPPFTANEPRPEYPVEVDDQYILPHQILGQPEGQVSLLTGFVQAIKIYETMNSLVSIELSYGLSSLSWFEQRSILFTCLSDAKTAVQDMPRELYLDMDTPPVGQVGSTDIFEDTPGYHYHPPAYPQSQPPTDIRHVLDTNPLRRRQLQYEIQKANIYASQLATRSHFVERYLNLRDVHRDAHREKLAGSVQQQTNGYTLNGSSTSGGYDDGKAVAAAAVHAAAQQDDPIDETMAAERELIVKNLLVVITSLPQQNMEPNGASLINKIRQVASTLLNDAPERKGPLAKKNEEYLARFLGILTRLEKTVPANAGLGVGVGMEGDYHGSMTPQDEEDELRNWADLREHQLRFANQGGFL
ncbi:hypothetical protein GE09DRAFT_905428, partial [Coniochaeta sp. 2T2.1]